MSTTTDDVVVRLRLKDVAKFIADVKSGKRSIEDLEKKIVRTGQVAKRESSEYGGLGLWGATVGRMKYAVAGLALTLTAGAGAMTRWAVSTMASQEQVEIGFKTLLGSQSAADAMISKLADFAERTPFNLANLEQNTRALVAFGLSAEQVIPTLTSLGNAVSAFGGNQDDLNGTIIALRQIASRGVLSFEELNQLAQHIPDVKKYLMAELGVNGQEFQKLVEARKIGSGTAIPIILKGLQNDFNGALEAQSQSIFGTWSNIIDKAQRQVVERTKPYRPIVKAWLQDLLDHVDEVADWIQRFLTATVTLAVRGWKFGKGLFDVIMGDFQTGGTTGGHDLGARAQGVVLGLVKKLGEMVRTIDWFSAGKETGSQTVPFIVGFLSGLLDPAAIAKAFKEHPLDFALGLLSLIGIGKLGGPIAKILEKLPILSHLAPVFRKWASITDFLLKPLGGFGRKLKSLFLDPVGVAFSHVFPALSRKLWWHWNLLLRDLKNPKTARNAILGLLGNLLKASPLGRFFNVFGGAIRNGIYHLFRGLFKWLRDWDAAKILKTGWIGTIVGVFVAAKDQITGLFEDMFKGISNGFIGMLNGMIDGLNGIMSVTIAGQRVGPQIPHIPGLADGGTVTAGGAVWVGERGPELLHLPKAAQVQPLPDVPDFEGGGVPLDVTLLLDGEVLMRRTIRHSDRALARL